MKKKKKINNKKTTNKPSETKTIKASKRWRPPKAFISKKPQIKRDGPGRPKKHEKIVLPQIPERKENKVKDGIILAIFIISFLVFGFSIYVSQKDKITSLWTKNNENEVAVNNSVEEDLETTEIAEITWENKETTWGNQEANIDPIVSQDEKYEILETIYKTIEELKFNEMYAYIDTNLKQSTTFKTYFSKNRLQRFVNNIDNQKINIELTNIDNNTSKVTYKLTYSIKNTPFAEEWEASFVTKDNQQKIAKIMCITQWCSKMPFFNPGKYF